MAITLGLVDFDSFFRSITGNKIIVNNISLFGEEIVKINNSLFTTYDKEIISTVPSCDCGAYKGAYSLGKICNYCSTPVSSIHDNKDPLLWLKVIDENIKFINPAYWNIFKLILGKNNIDWVRWLADSRYNPATPPTFILGALEVLGERNYFNLVNKMIDLLTYFQNNAKFKKSPEKQADLETLKELWINEPHNVMSNYLPIVNKKLFVMENTSKGKFINLSVSDVIDVVMLWIKVNTELRDSNKPITEFTKKIASSTVTVISKLASQYYTYYNKYIVGKSGTLRKHVYGARSHFTFRTVIVAIPGPHKYNQIIPPWSVGVTTLRPHLFNKLINKYNFTYKEANSLLFKAVKSYDPLIHQILNELISESPYELGIPVLMQRNPSLLYGSAVLVYIPYFKTDPNDKTTGVSGKSIKSMNGDYDGDELNFTLLLDTYMAEMASPFAPYNNAPGRSKPFEISNNLTLLAPATAVVSRYLRDKDENPKYDTIVSKLNPVEVTISE